MNEKSLEVYAYIWTVIVLSALALDICCIKWRSIAKLFLPIELVILFFTNLVQLEDTCQAYQFQFLVFVTFDILMFLCEIRISLIFIVLAGLAQIVKQSYIGDESFGKIVFSNSFMAFMASILALIIVKILQHVSQLHSRLRI